MSPAAVQLLKGAVKSALASLAGLSIGGTLLDPAQFSVLTMNGAKHTLILAAFTVGAAEVRYLGQWLSKWSES